MEQPQRKIAIISHSLGKGGAERFAAGLGIMLEGFGHQIHNIIIENAVDYEYVGSLYNLGEICAHKPKLQRKISKGILLQEYLKKHAIDTIIDNRSRNNFIREWLTKSIYGHRERFYVVHVFKLNEYFPDSKFLARLLYADAEKVICVAKAIETEVRRRFHLDNAITIYNPVDFSRLQVAKQPNELGNYILYFGRLDEPHKNFGLMLEAFAHSKVCQNGFKLLIMGDGPDAATIKSEISKWNLQSDVVLLPFQKNPFGIVGQAKFTLLTSRYEGFPMSIIESLGVGTPVVSVDCESGPSEVIQNGKNGLLVPNHDAHALAEAIRRLATDSDLYDICKHNAKASVAHLSVEHIAGQWQQILTQK